MINLAALARPYARRAAVLVGCVALPATTGGCSVFGLAAHAGSRQVVKPTYTGLANQSVGIMVSADRGIQQEHRRIQLDLAQAVDARLKQTQANKAEELAGTQFPRNAAPDAVFAFQRNYPQLEWEPVATVAPKLGVSRVIHVEVDAFTLHPDNVPELYRGELAARVQVVEVTGGTGKVAFDDRVTAVFPDDKNQAGTPNLDARATYRGTIDAFATAVLQRFVAYEAPR